MEVEQTASFVRDARRIRDADSRRRVGRVIEELEATSSITEVPNIYRITASSGRYYRIRIGDYRLGIALESDVVVLVRFMHRREIYRKFP